jgi:hypothetical protein
MKRVGDFGVKVADFFEQLWCRCNTLTILKESLTADGLLGLLLSAFNASGACHEHRWSDID